MKSKGSCKLPGHQANKRFKHIDLMKIKIMMFDHRKASRLLYFPQYSSKNTSRVNSQKNVSAFCASALFRSRWNGSKNWRRCSSKTLDYSFVNVMVSFDFGESTYWRWGCPVVFNILTELQTLPCMNHTHQDTVINFQSRLQERFWRK